MRAGGRFWPILAPWVVGKVVEIFAACSAHSPAFPAAPSGAGVQKQFFSIADSNSQDWWVLADADVSRFYKKLLKNLKVFSRDDVKVKEGIDTIHQ